MIEQEDANLKGGKYLENPIAAKITESEEGLLCAELIRDFLECYKMDYTLQIFSPECNLPAESKMKGKLASHLGLAGAEAGRPKIPVLLQLVSQQLKGGAMKANVLGSPLSPSLSEALAPPTDTQKSPNVPSVSPTPTKVPPYLPCSCLNVRFIGRRL